MEYMKLEAWKTKMIGLGCDGTNANIADGGLKGLLQREVPWVCEIMYKNRNGSMELFLVPCFGSMSLVSTTWSTSHGPLYRLRPSEHSLSLPLTLSLSLADSFF